MKTKAIAFILAALAVSLLTLFFNLASGKSETADMRPAIFGNKAEDLPVKHVGTDENQPL